jgi:dipeptidase D
MMLELEPKHVWRHFEALTQIPRPSGREKAAADYVISVAKEKGVEWEQSEVGNVVIRVPAKPGHEKAPITVLQGHLDMVCEKNSSSLHDFNKDPLTLRVEGNVVKASGTTLGADNGLGVAMGLALLDEPGATHGPLELLFTVDEERGLNGANGLASGFIKGRRMLNLDTEEDGSVYVGCAGGQDTVMTLRVGRAKAADERPVYKLSITGLRGGHSGVDIHEGRGNANRYLVRALQAMERRGVSFALVSADGGSKRNAIAREAFATFYMAKEFLGAAKDAACEVQASGRLELKGVDDGLNLTLEPGKAEFPPMAPASQAKLLTFLAAIPHGYMAFSREIPGLVETSTNFAIITTKKGSVEVCTSQRSSVMSQLAWAADWVANIGRLAGAKIAQSNGYPGWKPNLDSPILKAATATFKRVHGKEPKQKAIHAGLECGIIGDKFPGMDMVSIGPEIRNAHSPDEEVHIDSVQKTYKVLLELLKDLA